jgi:tetratricopeptide (TPR) repeat protein
MVSMEVDKPWNRYRSEHFYGVFSLIVRLTGPAGHCCPAGQASCATVRSSVIDPSLVGPELRRRRLDAGLTLRALARRLRYDPGYLSKIENGLRPAGLDVVRLYDGQLNAQGQLIALFLRGQRSTCDTPGAGAGAIGGGGVGAGAAAVSGTAVGLGPGSAGTGGVRAGGSGDGAAGVPAAGRHGSAAANAGRAAGAATVGGAVIPGQRTESFPLPPEPPGLPPTDSRLLRRLAQDDEVYAQMQARLASLRDQGRRFPPAFVTPDLIALTERLLQLADHSEPRGRNRWMLLAAYCAEYTGWMAQESGHSDVAIQWTDRAVRFAIEAGDPDLPAYALVRRAELAMYAQSAAEVVRAAVQAQADPASGVRVRMLAAHREAQGHAMAGRADQCRAALERADKLGAAEPDRPAGELMLGSSVPDVARFAAGWCWYELGDAQQAVDDVAPATASIPRHARRPRALYSARLAMAYAQAGELDQACDVAADSLDDARSVDSATVRHQLRNLNQLLRRWPQHRRASDVRSDVLAILRPTA